MYRFPTDADRHRLINTVAPLLGVSEHRFREITFEEQKRYLDRYAHGAAPPGLSGLTGALAGLGWQP